MSTLELPAAARRGDANDLDYRPLHMGAIASIVFGLLSVLVLLAGRESMESAVLMAPVPLVGIALALFALRAMRANPDQYTGRRAAVSGLALSGAFLAAGLAVAGYVQATETPPGYARISFAEMKPSEVDLRSGRLIPSKIAELDGQKVFIKGYFRPDSSPYTRNVREFLLVRDNNQCCFGDLNSVQFYDQIAVQLEGDLTVNYSPRLFRIGGTLRIDPRWAEPGSGGSVFSLQADHAQ
ncbi:MAG TPA: DUF4190 domain-containing protein [Lacipirellulaceae bacterium]|nr:DUF4190 domain-containing protein [Lacipirellulaceae bacterium]